MAEQSNSGNNTGPKSGIQKARHLIFCGVCALVIGFFAAYSNPTFSLQSGSRAEDSYYNLLVQGFRAGQLNLKMQVPPELGKIADPYDSYDPTVTSTHISGLNDLSYYKGKLYIYFGVTPALVLFWPYAALSGHYLSDEDAVLVFFAFGFFIAAALLLDVRQRYFPEANIWIVMISLFASGLAIALTRWCNTNEVAITCGFAFTMLALVAIWRAMHEPKRGVLWLLLASLAYGLAVGSRPSLLFGVMILLIPVAQAWSDQAHPCKLACCSWQRSFQQC